ncbi:hypothetical protein L218DRAFT_217595 [Marasmius fiardii PR-910]|nr:hypothetical protein L218DRAFT_217595 [Marasmius fiardii PR-910]
MQGIMMLATMLTATESVSGGCANGDQGRDPVVRGRSVLIAHHSFVRKLIHSSLNPVSKLKLSCFSSHSRHAIQRLAYPIPKLSVGTTRTNVFDRSCSFYGTPFGCL